MADGINKLKLLPRLLLATALSAATGLVIAEEAQSASYADPTRPPAAVLDPSQGNAVVSSGLQTVIIRRGAKSSAIINGQTVELGGKVGDARLVKINESQVELQGPGGKEVMRLTPAVDIKPRIHYKAKAANAHKRGGGKAKRAPSKSKSNHKH